MHCKNLIEERRTGSRRIWRRIWWTIHRCRCLQHPGKYPYSTRSPEEHSGGTLATHNLTVFKHLYGLSTGYMIHGATDSDSTLHIKTVPRARKPGEQGSACSWSGSYSGRACLLSGSSSRSASRIFVPQAVPSKVPSKLSSSLLYLTLDPLLQSTFRDNLLHVRW
jgi:hypothetical protein